jgi:quercetin dioxygenase-like cupin family protein
MSEPNAFVRGLAATTIAISMTTLAGPSLAIGPDLHVDVTPSSVPQEVQLVEHDLRKGQSTGWHIHHGVELTYVQQGHVQFNVGSQGPINLRAGGSIEIERDTPHKATNVGSERAILIISYLMDKGAPAAIPVPGPTVPSP